MFTVVGVTPLEFPVLLAKLPFSVLRRLKVKEYKILYIFFNYISVRITKCPNINQGPFLKFIF